MSVARRTSPGWFPLLLCASLAASLLAPAAEPAPRESVHPRRNVDEFPPVSARFVRFLIHDTNSGEPCIDELEIYGPEDERRNLALAANGARATASGSVAGYTIHRLEGVNDGRYGNGHSWIANRRRECWVQLELPETTRVNKVIWGRDREGRFIDRLATKYEIQVATAPDAWQTVASSRDRLPLVVGAQLSGQLALTRQYVNRFAPVGTTLSSELERAPAEYIIDVWQTANGLPGNTVTAILQTPDGYLWVATLNGLARFDGIRFKVFGETSGLPNIRVLCLSADADGTLWLGTDGGGLVRFRDGVFQSFTQREGLASDIVLSLAGDSSARLWIGTTAGLSCLANGKFVEDKARAAVGAQAVSGLFLEAGRAPWFLIAGGLWRVDDSGRLMRPPYAAEPSLFTTVFAAQAGGSGRVWFGGANGYVGALSNGTLRVFREQPGQLLDTVWELREARNGDLWVGMASGGLRRLRGGQFTSVTTQEGLSDNSVRCLLEDREGCLWVGTVGGGLNRLKPRRVTTYTTRDGLSHNVVMSLAEDPEGVIWIGSNCGGLSAGQAGRFAPSSASYLLDNECIWSLLSERDGSLWIGTWGGGLFRKQGTRVERFTVSSRDNEEAIVSLCPDRSGGVWLGTVQGGLKLFRDGRFTHYTTQEGLSANFVTAIVQEPDGALWLGTSGGGLNRFQDGRFSSFSRRDGLPSDFIRTLHRDDHGVLWIGTSGGLARRREGRFDTWTRAQGLPDEVISQIVEDVRENLWFGSNQGIFRLDRRELEEVASRRRLRLNPVVYGRGEGMEGVECTGGFHPAGLRSRDGKLWFSTVKGLVMVDPEKVPRNELPPPVVLEQILVDGRALVLPAPPPGAGAPAPGTWPEFTLGPGVQRLEIDFSVLSLIAPEHNRCRYQLEGLDTGWVDAGLERTAAYSHPPAGRYRFRVTGANNDGVWDAAGASVSFRIVPPIWRTPWFLGLSAAAALGAGGWMVRRWSLGKLRRRLEQVERQHTLEQERARIARDIHDELGASLTRIALLSEVGRRHLGRPAEIATDLGRIAATAGEAVRAMDAIVWAVNPLNDSLDHFANYVSQFAEDFFRLTPIRCRLDLPADLPEKPLSTEARHQLFLAVKEGLNNVVRHSGATEVWIRLSCDGGQLVLWIEDNGRGLPHEGAGPGQDGLRNLRQRLEKLGGRTEVETGPGQGTRLRMSLPLTSHANPNRHS